MRQVQERKRNILFIGGSLNQTTMMHKVSGFFPSDNLFFSPYYGDGYIHVLRKTGLLDFSILGGKFFETTMNYFKQHDLQVDYRGLGRKYDLVFTCQDLIFPRNIMGTRVVLIQEGMTDPENLAYYLVKYAKLPRYFASTSVTGLSHGYDRFCVASEGYREHFIKKGVNPEKIVVTGIPNFDDCDKFRNNNFPHRNFVLVATSDARETFKFENRKAFIIKAKRIAAGRPLIFKLHPNENVKRATAEINKYAPGALVYHTGSIEEMIANADVLVTKYSSTAYVGIALGKEVHSYFDLEELKRMTPIQNGGDSARLIAAVGEELLNTPIETLKKRPKRFFSTSRRSGNSRRIPRSLSPFFNK